MSKNQHQPSQSNLQICKNCISVRQNPVNNFMINNSNDESTNFQNNASNRSNENIINNNENENLFHDGYLLNSNNTSNGENNTNNNHNNDSNNNKFNENIALNLNKKRNIITNSLNNQTDSNHDLTQAANSLNRSGCIIERLNFLYLNDTLADVHFLVGKKPIDLDNLSIEKSDYSEKLSSNLKINNSKVEKIPAHKLVLSIGSQVFMAMFYGTGSHMLSTNEVEIPDVEPESFKNMLKYLYTDELHIEPDSVMSTLYVAKKYAIGTLERECVDFLKNNLRPDNAFMLLEQALLFGEQNLAELCLNLIDKNSCEAFSSECFLDVEIDTLVLILKRDSLGIREFKLYYYVLKWAQNKCIKLNLLPINRENQKLVLGDAINLIRFPLMSKEEFAIAMNDLDSRIIDDKSIIDLFINLTLTNHTFPSNSFLPKKLLYNDTPRCCLGGKEQVINRFSQVESRWGYSGTSDRVRFSVSKRIFILGFGLYGSIYGKCEYQVIIQLIHYESCKTCAHNSTTFICDGTNSTFRVYFKEPIEIFSDTDYIASATLKGPDSFYGTKGLRRINHDVGSEREVIFNFQYASGNNNGTSVEDGQIPEIIFLYSCS